jgi:hypothetical protein
MTSDSDLREALLGTWRLINYPNQLLGDNPQGYLAYTPDDHVFFIAATRAQRTWPGPEVLELSGPQATAATGFSAYCGTFQVRDGQVIHHREFGSLPRMSGSVEPRSVVLDGDRLTLSTPTGTTLEWQRVHAEENPQ